MNVNDLNRLIKEHRRLLGVQNETIIFRDQALADLEVIKTNFSLNSADDRHRLADVEGRIRSAALGLERVESALGASEAALRDGVQAFVDAAGIEGSKLFDAALLKTVNGFRPFCESQGEAESFARQANKPRRILAAAEHLKVFTHTNHPPEEAAQSVVDQWEKFKATLAV